MYIDDNPYCVISKFVWWASVVPTLTLTLSRYRQRGRHFVLTDHHLKHRTLNQLDIVVVPPDVAETITTICQLLYKCPLVDSKDVFSSVLRGPSRAKLIYIILSVALITVPDTTNWIFVSDARLQWPPFRWHKLVVFLSFWLPCSPISPHVQGGGGRGAKIFFSLSA